MIKTHHNETMGTGLIIAFFLVFVALSPFLGRSGDLDDRSRRGWWVNR